MKQWYQELTKKQKIFIYLLAILGPWTIAGPMGQTGIYALPFLYIPLAILIFLKLGDDSGK